MGFSQSAKLLASDGQSGDWFGRQVSVDGTTAVIGALYGDSGGKGQQRQRLCVHQKRNRLEPASQDWIERRQSNDWFGYDVGVSGEQVLVGAPYADLMGMLDAGAGYTFLRTGAMWTQTAKLTASDVSPSGFLAMAFPSMAKPSWSGRQAGLRVVRRMLSSGAKATAKPASPPTTAAVVLRRRCLLQQRVWWGQRRLSGVFRRGGRGHKRGLRSSARWHHLSSGSRRL